MADGNLTGTLSNRKLSGEITSTSSVNANLSTTSMSGNLSSNSVHVQAEWDDIIGKPEFVGVNVEGRVFTPYTVDEENNYVYIYDEPMEAIQGAEILNDYENNIAVGHMAQASGYMTQAVGNYSKAEGWWTRADGQCAVASGLLSIASGHFSHAEGTRTQATINNAHSEGDLTVASGRQSHAEGQKTVASGFCSHAEGSQTQATNYYSHAEGLGTIAKGRNQTTMGKYNVADTTSLLIIGNGTKDSNRSNALKLSSDGDLTLSGDAVATDENGNKISLVELDAKLQSILDQLENMAQQSVVGLGIVGNVILGKNDI